MAYKSDYKTPVKKDTSSGNTKCVPSKDPILKAAPKNLGKSYARRT